MYTYKYQPSDHYKFKPQSSPELLKSVLMIKTGKEVATAQPKVRVIETSYVTIADPSSFKSVVQSLTGAGAGAKMPAGRKRDSFEEAGVHVAVVAAEQSGGVNMDKRQCCAGERDSSALVKGDSFNEEIYRMWVPELSDMEDKHWKWLFNDDDSVY